ncbi:unnamed protein product [Peniophora sp. CBMAI 1063]|nr:unnamed protein product [Peniophora sp. CBMAI 1063]
MDEPMNDDPPFTLASDSPGTWAKVADLTLRHIARIRVPPTHPDDLRSDNKAPAMLSQRPSLPVHQSIVSQEAHIPFFVRKPRTVAYVREAIERVSVHLSRRPSEFLIGDTNRWACPGPTCAYTVQLEDLSSAQMEVIGRIANGLHRAWTSDVGKLHIAVREYWREVVDIVALAHYEEVHLHGLGIKHVIRGQGDDGRLEYFWEFRDWKAALELQNYRGVRARIAESRSRSNMQRALGFEARAWASDVLSQVQQEECDARASAREQQSDFVRDEYDEHLNLELNRADSLFEPRGVLFAGHGSTTREVQRPIRALRRLHEYIYGQQPTPNVEESRAERRAGAEAELLRWAVDGNH